MNSNCTIISGVNDDHQNKPNQVASTSPQFMNGGGTVIPGVAYMDPQPKVSNPSTNGQILGFLFSVSKTAAGEYWPLMLGGNTIGRGQSNSIVLNECTVSENHASIHVISRSDRLIVYIKDDQSKTGTLHNGNLIRGEADLKNGDIITVGENYELLVVLISAVEHGLAPKPNFRASNPSPAQAAQQTMVMPGMTNTVTHGTVVEGSTGTAPIGGHTLIMGKPLK